MYMVCQLLITR